MAAVATQIAGSAINAAVAGGMKKEVGQVGSAISAVGDMMKEVGQAIHPGEVPLQMDMNTARMGLTVEESVYIKGKDGINEVFVKDQLDMSKLAQDLCFPACCTHIPFISEKRKMEYEKLCGPCSCRWAVNIDDKQVGAMKDVGCCDNGCLFCCCPCFVYDGYAKVMGMENANKDEKFVILSKLFPCWPLAMGLGCMFSGFGALFMAGEGCYKYVNGESIKTIAQPVYQGPWSRGKNAEPPKQIGTFYGSQRFTPICCCLACPTPMRFYYKATTPEGANLEMEEQTILGMVLQLYRGMPTPCKMCSPAGFRTPTGICCLDMGLETSVSWSSPKEALQNSS